MSQTITENPQGTLIIGVQGPGPTIIWQASNLNTQGHLVSGQAQGATAITASFSAAGLPVAPTISGNDTAGRITWSTASGAAIGAQVAVAFGTPYATTPTIMLTEANASTAGAYPYITPSTTGFLISTGLIPVVSGTYAIHYLVMA